MSLPDHVTVLTFAHSSPARRDTPLGRQTCVSRPPPKWVLDRILCIAQSIWEVVPHVAVAHVSACLGPNVGPGPEVCHGLAVHLPGDDSGWPFDNPEGALPKRECFANSGISICRHALWQKKLWRLRHRMAQVPHVLERAKRIISTLRTCAHDSLSTARQCWYHCLFAWGVPPKRSRWIRTTSSSPRVSKLMLPTAGNPSQMVLIGPRILPGRLMLIGDWGWAELTPL